MLREAVDGRPPGVVSARPTGNRPKERAGVSRQLTERCDARMLPIDDRRSEQRRARPCTQESRSTNDDRARGSGSRRANARLTARSVASLC